MPQIAKHIVAILGSFTLNLRHTVLGLFMALSIVACGGGGGGGGGGGNNNPPIPIGPFSISGSITPISGTRIDSDVNDPSYIYIRNDSINEAQELPNPVALGGFASVTGSGPSPDPNFPSRFGFIGDVQDFYRVPLLAGQVINLRLGNPTSNLDLILRDINGNEVPGASSRLGLGLNESITVPGSFTNAQDFFIEVVAVAGVSNYTLTVGLSTQALDTLGVQHDFVPGEVIVKFKDKMLPAGVAVDSLAMRADAVGLRAVSGAPGRSMLMRVGNAQQLSVARKKLLITASSESVPDSMLQRKLDTIDVVRALNNRTDVESARLNYIYKPMATPDDRFFGAQWNFPLINLPQAWDITQGSNDVVVAVIDTGVMLNHEDFVNLDSSSQLVAGFDFIRDSATAADGDGIDANPDDPGDRGLGFASTFHGTHVAGTIAAASNNMIGVAGIGWNVKVMPLRALGVGGGTSYDIEQAVRYAAGLPNDSGTVPARKADIINLSLGGVAGSGPTPEAYVQARAAGSIIVAAAGNDGANIAYYPASYNDAVFSVSAVDLNKTRAPYSNFNSSVDVSAPGGDASQNLNGDSFPDAIISMVGNDLSSPIESSYGLKQGTSMATPHIAGVAALMKSVHSNMTPTEFENALISGMLTEDLGVTGVDEQYGHGLIDALSAVLTAQQLAMGGSLPDNPFMAVSPGSLNFGASAVNNRLNVRNIGSGVTPLTVTSVTNDSSGWLTHTAPPGASGLGDYAFSVDRTNLADGIYSATITIVSSVNTVTIPVIMQVSTTPSVDSAGLLYILLYDPINEVAVAQTSANLVNGNYSFEFEDRVGGIYQIYAGTDLDNDGAICDEGEACGFYPDSTPDNPAFILDRNLDNVDFIVGFGTLLSASQVQSTARLPAQGIAIKKAQP